MTYPTSTVSSACPTPRTGSITTRLSASPNCSPTSSPPPCQPGTDQGFDRAREGQAGSGGLLHANDDDPTSPLPDYRRSPDPVRRQRWPAGAGDRSHQPV